MRRMFILGLTGPSGAGKSLAAQHLVQRGFSHVDADKAARAIAMPGSPCLKELAAEFGTEIICADGSLDRKKLAKLAFGGNKVERLNAITHPYIINEINRALSALESSGARYAILDAPALFESGADRICDRILAVTAGRELRIKRIMERDGITQEQAQSRVDAQPDDDFYTTKADFTAGSDNGEAELFAAVDRAADTICRGSCDTFTAEV